MLRFQNTLFWNRPFENTPQNSYTYSYTLYIRVSSHSSITCIDVKLLFVTYLHQVNALRKHFVSDLKQAS